MKQKIQSLKVIGVEQRKIGFGYNWFAQVEINGTQYTAMKQGGMNFWAFCDRPKFDAASLKQLDEILMREVDMVVFYETDAG